MLLSGVEPKTFRLLESCTSDDALPLSYRSLVGANAIKLVSWDKHPAYYGIYVWHMRNGINVINVMNVFVTKLFISRQGCGRLEVVHEAVVLHLPTKTRYVSLFYQCLW